MINIKLNFIKLEKVIDRIYIKIFIILFFTWFFSLCSLILQLNTTGRGWLRFYNDNNDFFIKEKIIQFL